MCPRELSKNCACVRLILMEHRGCGAIGRIAGIRREELGWSDARPGEEIALARAALEAPSSSERRLTPRRRLWGSSAVQVQVQVQVRWWGGPSAGRRRVGPRR